MGVIWETGWSFDDDGTSDDGRDQRKMHFVFGRYGLSFMGYLTFVTSGM